MSWARIILIFSLLYWFILTEICKWYWINIFFLLRVVQLPRPVWTRAAWNPWCRSCASSSTIPTIRSRPWWSRACASSCWAGSSPPRSWSPDSFWCGRTRSWSGTRCCVTSSELFCSSTLRCRPCFKYECCRSTFKFKYFEKIFNLIFLQGLFWMCLCHSCEIALCFIRFKLTPLNRVFNTDQ